MNKMEKWKKKEHSELVRNVKGKYDIIKFHRSPNGEIDNNKDPCMTNPM